MPRRSLTTRLARRRVLAALLSWSAATALGSLPVYAQAQAQAQLQSQAQDEVVYRFSPVNQYGINLTAAYWNPIISWVSEKAG
jgi:phosphonate transport system substrate-binding protein